MDSGVAHSTSPFHTLDAFDGTRLATMMDVMDEIAAGDVEAWSAFLHQQPTLVKRLQEQGLTTPEEYSTIAWDDAMVLFTSCVEVTSEGRPLPLGDALTRERFGRFPSQDGSPLNYFLEFIRPNLSVTENDGQSIYDTIIASIRQLTLGCTEAYRGHDRYVNGFGGMRIHGYLSFDQVQELRRNLASRAYTVSQDEPIDGGLADVAKHLTSLLKAAERRRVGIVYRSHG